jgi:lambda family phage tail tape measure protein
MAGNTVEYELLFSDKSNSMQKRIDDAKTLNKEMSQAAKSSFRAEGDKGISGQDYGRARGAAGTGASARDFAKESQGLGGLVRLYATVAANLFAVGAAFNSLREAMNTTNMVQGLNQLGATSGQSLGTLAKNLATASGGALSLRDAMEATAKATSAGMSSRQLMQLGSVAKNASQALGLSMTDAVSRLTRGIVKLEPELLDELGLFTKIGPATEEYARSVGKSVSALTDFERRQAFANAVLKEGTDKFNAINIPTNPYDKLLASLKDLAQNGLEVVNKYLGPVLDSLSQSPGALTAGIAYLSAMLVKQALPALTEYREGLLASAKASKEAADYRAAEAKKAQESQATKVRQMAESAAEKEVAAADAAVKRIEDLRSTSFGKQSKGYAILQKAAQDVSKEELDYLNKVGARYEKQGKLDIANRYYEAAKAINASKKAEEDYGRVVDETTRKLNQQQSLWTARGRAEIMAKRTADVAASKQILSSASTDTSTIGVFGAFTEMKKSLKESDMGPIRKGFTAISGVATIATTAITGFVGALQGVIGLATAIAGIAMLIDSWFTKNSEKAKEFTTALETSDEMLKTYERTLAFLSKQNPEVLFQSKALTAQANALQGLVDGLTTVREKFEDLDKATSGWDRFTDRLAGLVGKDQLSKFAEGTVKNIVQTIAAIDSEVARETALKTVTAELGALGDGQLQWLDAIKRGGPEAAKAVQKVEQALKKVANEQSNVASRSTEFDESIVKLSGTYKDFTKSAIDQSPLTKLGDDLAASAVKMVAALDDPIAGIGSMKKLLEDTSVLGIFNPALVQQVNRLKPEIDSLNQKHGQTVIQLRNARQEVMALELEYQKLDKMYGGVDRDLVVAQGGDTIGIDKLEEATARMNKKQADLAALVRKDTEERAKIAELMNSPKFKEIAVEAFVTGSKLVSMALDQAFEKARIDLGKGIIGMMGSTPGIAKIESQMNQAEFALQKRAVSLQEEMLRAQYSQIAATMANTAALNLKSTQDAYGNMGAMRSQPGIAAAEAAMAESELTTKFQAFITGGKSAPSSKNFLQDLNNAMRTFGKDSPEVSARINQMRMAVKSFMDTAAERAKITTNEQLDNIKTEAKVRDEINVLANDALKLQATDVAGQIRSIDILAQQNGRLTDKQLLDRQALENQQSQLEYDQQINSVIADREKFEIYIDGLKKAGITKGVEELKINFTKLENTKNLSAAQTKTDKDRVTALKTQQDLNKNIFEEENIALNNKLSVQETYNIQQSTALELTELQLELDEKRLALTPQDLANKQSAIAFRKIEQEETTKLASLEINYLKAVTGLLKQYRDAAEGDAGEGVRTRVTQDLENLSNRYKTEVNGTRTVAQAKRDLTAEDAKYSERQKAYGEVFEKSFQSMGDAMVTFAKTGKFSFDDMISSMIEGLIRYEMQLQATATYAAFRPGLMNGVASIFDRNFEGSGYTAAQLATLPNAKGNAFDYGLQAFAKGGAFTNQIVDSPTLFKFARGTGLMGEAGPEAIMPLKRDSNGNLGVSNPGGGGNVEVVVNNYSTAQAETRETTDSRGNRRIEVIVGDMVAQEVAKTGSATQNAFSSTYGTRPALARR